MPVIPASQEAETGKSLESRRRMLQKAKIMLLHFSLGNRVRLHLKKTKQKPMAFFTKIEKNNSKNYMKPQKIQNSQSYPEGKNKKLG